MGKPVLLQQLQLVEPGQMSQQGVQALITQDPVGQSMKQDI